MNLEAHIRAREAQQSKRWAELRHQHEIINNKLQEDVRTLRKLDSEVRTGQQRLHDKVDLLLVFRNNLLADGT